jgi:hypothetical protein
MADIAIVKDGNLALATQFEEQLFPVRRGAMFTSDHERRT